MKEKEPKKDLLESLHRLGEAWKEYCQEKESRLNHFLEPTKKKYFS